MRRWYLGWKSLFPEDLLDHERVRAQMGAALNLMNSAVDGRPQLPGGSQWQQQPAAAAAAAVNGEPRSAAPAACMWFCPVPNRPWSELG